MKRTLTLLGIIALLALLLGIALAEAPVALIAPTEIRMFKENTYIDGSIVVGRGRQTYIYMTVPEGGFSSVTLNLRNQHGAAWGQLSEGAEKVWDTIAIRICTAEEATGVLAPADSYTAYTAHGAKDVDEAMDITALVKAHLEQHPGTSFVIELAGYYQLNGYHDNGAWEGNEEHLYCTFSGSAAQDTWAAPAPEGEAEDIFADAVRIAPTEIRMYAENTYTDGSIIVGRARQTYIYFEAPEGGFDRVYLNLRNDWGRAWGETAEGSAREYDQMYLRICTPIMVRGILVKPQYYTAYEVREVRDVDQQLDITDLVKAHMEKHKTNTFIVELAGYYEVNEYYDNGAWEGSEDYTYCIYTGTAAEGNWTEPIDMGDVDPMTDYIPYISEESVVAGDLVFKHPGVLFNKQMLRTMVTGVRQQKDPWYSTYLELLTTNEGSLNPEIIISTKNDVMMNGRVTNNTLYNTVRRDADTAMSQATLYLITGNAKYRENAMYIIRQFGSIKVLGSCADEQIIWSLITYKLCATAEMLKYSTTNVAELAWTEEYDGYMTHFLTISRQMWDRFDHFMNQHLMCVLGTTAAGIYQNDADMYRRGVLRGTVNPEFCNIEGCDHLGCQYTRSGAISMLFRINTVNALTGESISPTLQFAEMGRDQGHCVCDVAATSTLAMMTWVQDTKVDPVSGEISAAEDAVYIWDFLDERIIKTCNLFYKYNLGYAIPWYPIVTNEGSYAANGLQEIYAEINPQYDYVGYSGDVAGIAYIYYRHYLGRTDLDTNPDTMYLSMARANKYPEGNEQDWIGWADLYYTPAKAAAFDQKAQQHAIAIQGKNCTWSCARATAAFGDLVTVTVTANEGYTMNGASVTVNGVAVDVARQVTFAGSDTVVELVFGMPQADATVTITPVQK